MVGKEAETIAQYQDLFRQQDVQVVLVADSDTLKLLEDKSRFAAHLPTEIAVLPETVTIQNLAQLTLRTLLMLLSQWSLPKIKLWVSLMWSYFSWSFHTHAMEEKTLKSNHQKLTMIQM